MGHYDDCYDDFYVSKPKVSLNSETKKSLKIGPDPEVQRLRDALCTIGSLLTKYSKTRPADALNISIALDIIDGALDGEWPAYGVVPKQAAEYLIEREKENGTKK